MKNGALTRDHQAGIVVVALKSMQPVVIKEKLEVRTALMATNRLTTKMYVSDVKQIRKWRWAMLLAR